MKTSLHSVTWKLIQLNAKLFDVFCKEPPCTLGKFCSDHGLEPVWGQEEAANQAVRERLVALCSPAFDEGEAFFEVLDFDPLRRVSAFRSIILVVNVLKDHYDAVGQTLGLQLDEVLTQGRAFELVAAAVDAGLTQDDFEGAIGRVYVGMLSRGRIEQAESVLYELAPHRPLFGYSFSEDCIPLSVRSEATGFGVYEAFQALDGDECALVKLKKYVARGVVRQSALDEKIREIILLKCRDGEEVVGHLRPYVDVLVTAQEIAEAKIELHRFSLEELAEGRAASPVTMAAQLREKGVDAALVEASLKFGCLKSLAAHGLSCSAYQDLCAELVTEYEKDEALRRYAALLAANPVNSDQWVEAAIAHRQYFAQGVFDRAIFLAAYQAKWGYDADLERFQRLCGLNPALPWHSLDLLAPSIVVCGESLRALVMARLSDPVDIALARVVCDWMYESIVARGTGRIDWSMLGRHFRRLGEALALHCGGAVRKPESALGGAKHDERGKRALTVFLHIPESVPYGALLRVRRVVAQVVREKVGAEIDPT